MGPKILLGIILIFHLQIWPPMVVKFLTFGVWKVLYTWIDAPPATDGAEFRISCKQPAFLSIFRRLQVIQN